MLEKIIRVERDKCRWGYRGRVIAGEWGGGGCVG